MEGTFIGTIGPRLLATATVEHDPDGDDEENELWLTIADDGGEPADLEWLETALRRSLRVVSRRWRGAGDTD